MIKCSSSKMLEILLVSLMTFSSPLGQVCGNIVSFEVDSVSLDSAVVRWEVGGRESLDRLEVVSSPLRVNYYTVRPVGDLCPVTGSECDLLRWRAHWPPPSSSRASRPTPATRWCWGEWQGPGPSTPPALSSPLRSSPSGRPWTRSVGRTWCWWLSSSSSGCWSSCCSSTDGVSKSWQGQAGG